ncbi:MAG TPA: type II toxin-antitoxin system HipA family toxin [Acidimicrobiales bacterium]|jgi:serine/threonine-protein kinase HipA
MAGQLAVWLYGQIVATIESERRRLRLRYTPDALRLYPGGSPLLSLTLPVSSAQFGSGVVRPFLDGLLPEGDPRRAIAEDLGLRADDTFGLIRALGRDCAGAIVIQPTEDPAPPPVTTTTAEPLTDGELAELIANLRTVPLGANDRVRISLAGVQQKLLLTRLPDGRWGRPVDGTPSTHILKPDIRGYPNTVENEAFCMRLARYLGLPVAQVETVKIGERALIVVTRYDRRVDPDGRVKRIHQEDLCQATGIPPARKYQEEGGPSLRTLAGILGATDPGSLRTLLGAIVLNVLVGNGDAHGKNYSLLHESSGTLRMAPLYDVMSTLYYRDDRLAMYIDDVRRTDRVTTDRILNEASLWGMARRTASDIVGDLLGKVPEAVDRAIADTPAVPDEIQRIVTSQLGRLRESS